MARSLSSDGIMSNGVLPIISSRRDAPEPLHLRAAVGVPSLGIHLPDEVGGGLDSGAWYFAWLSRSASSTRVRSVMSREMTAILF